MLHTHSIVDMGKHFVIDPTNRTITPAVEKVVLVQGDHNSERYTFEIPRFVDGHDMSLTNRVEIHYDNISKDKKYTNEGLYISKDAIVNGDKIEFSWLVSGNATKLAGKTQFWINFICLDSNDNVVYSWGTDVFKSINILPNNRNTEEVVVKFPDLLSQWKEEIVNSIEVSGESFIDFVESPTEDGALLCLRDMDSGMYVLSGRFKPYKFATVTYTYSNNILVSIIRDDDVSYVQIFYPKNNTVQYLEVYDDDVIRKDAKLADMQTVSNLVTAIDDGADDEHYPSAKAVKDLVDSIDVSDIANNVIASVDEDVLVVNKIPNVSSIATDETLSYTSDGILRVNTTYEIESGNNLPVTSDAVFSELNNKQSIDNLVTSIDDTSDDVHYPSAKAVKTLVDSIPGGVTVEQIAQAVASYMEENPIEVGTPASIGVVELLADNWVGSNNLYSQVVSIDGVTKYSQVDLTPSVEQLVIFYEKDLTFVTENEGGVVTVYVIGQKPTNDYTIQVTITEVEV